jgi:hypothetical protein
MALEDNAVSQVVIMNYLTRLTEDTKAGEVAVPKELALSEEPKADCSAYDRLLRG